MPGIVLNKFDIRSRGGLPIATDVRFCEDCPGRERYKPAVFLLHGFKSYKDWGFMPVAAEYFAENGFISCSFNFSHSASIDPIEERYDAELFKGMTVSGELEDLDVVIESLIDGAQPFTAVKPLWDGRIYLIGHSLGGALSLLYSAQKPRRIEKVALWASVSKVDRQAPRQKEEWKKLGYSNLTAGRHRQPLKLSAEYIYDIEKNFPGDAILRAAGRITIPALVIHGTMDVLVKTSEAHALREALKNSPDLRFELIERTGHAFSCENPCVKPSPALEKILGITKTFLHL